MSGTMLVLFAKKTGHVLAAATVTVVPQTLVTAAVLVGESLHLRNQPDTSPPTNWHLEIPSDEIGIAVVDEDEQLLADPFIYEMGSDGRPQQLQALRAAPTITPSVNKLNVQLTGSSLTQADVGLDVLVCEEGVASDVAVVQRAVTDSAHAATVNTTVTGTRIVLGLVAGYPLAVHLLP